MDASIASAAALETGIAAAGESRAAAGPILFFDGVCGLCNRSVDFAMAHDRRQRLLFAPLQGETARTLLDPADVASLDSVVLLNARGVHRRSAAVVRVLWLLGGVWTILGMVLWVIPKPLRDLGYGFVARYRYRWFGRKESCRMPTPQERSRFLP
jgi:predicted DCC family thiol-disulfide oxidoreductase YuxK